VQKKSLRERKRLQELKHVQSIITSCDKNGDNQISLDEVPKRYNNSNPVGVYDIELKELCFISQYEFSAKDKNHDNILTAGELLAKNNVIPYPIVEDINSEERDKIREASLKRHYELCDKNSDGKLSLAEATTKKCRIPSEIFIESDSNKDNFLTLEEISKGAKEHEQRVPIVTPVRPIKLPPTMPVEIRMMIKLTTCDTNRDRKLSEEEAVSCNFSKEVFKESDKNKDGFFSEEDMTIFNLLRQFKRIDKNGDDYLDIKEFQEGA
jgi:Ca2+-binding EF-hand superfamily protein